MTTLKEASVAFLRGPLAIFHGTFTDIMWNAGRTPCDKSFCNNVYRAPGESPVSKTPCRAAATEAAGIYARIARTG